MMIASMEKVKQRSETPDVLDPYESWLAGNQLNQCERSLVSLAQKMLKQVRELEWLANPRQLYRIRTI